MPDPLNASAAELPVPLPPANTPEERERVLKQLEANPGQDSQCLGVVLVPTKELAAQVRRGRSRLGWITLSWRRAGR